MMEEKAREKWNYYSRLSAYYAQCYFSDEYDYWRDLSKKYYALALRWRWAWSIIVARSVFKRDHIPELLKRFPKYYRVRPQ